MADPAGAAAGLAWLRSGRNILVARRLCQPVAWVRVHRCRPWAYAAEGEAEVPTSSGGRRSMGSRGSQHVVVRGGGTPGRRRPGDRYSELLLSPPLLSASSCPPFALAPLCRTAATSLRTWISSLSTRQSPPSISKVVPPPSSLGIDSSCPSLCSTRW